MRNKCDRCGEEEAYKTKANNYYCESCLLGLYKNNKTYNDEDKKNIKIILSEDDEGWQLYCSDKLNIRF